MHFKKNEVFFLFCEKGVNYHHQNDSRYCQQCISFWKNGKQQPDRFPFVTDGRKAICQGVCR